MDSFCAFFPQYFCLQRADGLFLRTICLGCRVKGISPVRWAVNGSCGLKGHFPLPDSLTWLRSQNVGFQDTKTRLSLCLHHCPHYYFSSMVNKSLLVLICTSLKCKRAKKERLLTSRLCPRSMQVHCGWNAPVPHTQT